jgi:hypothetical protein
MFVSGEFAEREKLLADLTLEQVNHVPPGVSHSIFAELWHLTRWQVIIAFRDEDLYTVWEWGENFPSTPAGSLEEWHALVARYRSSVEKVLEWAASPEKLALETDPGVTMADNLNSLAVHNAYHFGKIMSLRQQQGAWAG